MKWEEKKVVMFVQSLSLCLLFPFYIVAKKKRKENTWKQEEKRSHASVFTFLYCTHAPLGLPQCIMGRFVRHSLSTINHVPIINPCLSFNYWRGGSDETKFDASKATFIFPTSRRDLHGWICLFCSNRKLNFTL